MATSGFARVGSPFLRRVIDNGAAFAHLQCSRGAGARGVLTDKDDGVGDHLRFDISYWMMLMALNEEMSILLGIDQGVVWIWSSKFLLLIFTLDLKDFSCMRNSIIPRLDDIAAIAA